MVRGHRLRPYCLSVISFSPVLFTKLSEFGHCCGGSRQNWNWTSNRLQNDAPLASSVTCMTSCVTWRHLMMSTADWTPDGQNGQISAAKFRFPWRPTLRSMIGRRLVETCRVQSRLIWLVTRRHMENSLTRHVAAANWGLHTLKPRPALQHWCCTWASATAAMIVKIYCLRIFHSPRVHRVQKKRTTDSILYIHDTRN